MKTSELIKHIKGVFFLPKKRYYFGRVTYGAPYMYPTGYCKSIIKIRKEIPTFNRISYFKLGSYYIFYGSPIKVRKVELGWKDKFNSPRHEWSPQFHVYLFGLQFSIFWGAPDGDDDKYYEMILWYLHYADKDIVKAEKTWGWVDFETRASTWRKSYVVNLRKLKLEKLEKFKHGKKN